MGRMPAPPDASAPAAPPPPPPVGIGRPPVLTPAPAGGTKAPHYLPLSTGAAASFPRPRLLRGERRGALRLSVFEGIFAASHSALSGNGIGGNVFTIGFALFLGAKDPELGLLVAIPQLALVAQAHAAWLLREARSRRRVVIAACAISRGSVALWPLLPIVFGRSALHVFLGLWAIASVAGSYAGNAWMSWMADLVPRAVRGRYFSQRNNICNVVALAVSVATGVALDRWGGGAGVFAAAAGGERGGPRPLLFAGFAVVFGVAVVMGLFSVLILARQAEPARPPREAGLAPARESLIAPFCDPMFRRVLIFYGFFWAVNGAANPFWTPFVLEDLGCSYGFVTALGLLGGACGLVALPLWGRLIDRIGSRPVIAVIVLVTATHPIYYLVAARDFLLPIYADAISSGVVWGGFNLALFNLVLAAAPRGPGREMYYAAFNGTGGLAMATTSALAGRIAAALAPVEFFGRTFSARQEIFAAVTILRIFALFLLFHVAEPPAERRPTVVSEPKKEPREAAGVR